MHLVGEADPAQPRSPALGLFLTEPLRSAAEFAALPWAVPWLARAPRGDGHGVLVLPGLMASDASTRVLRRFLHGLGYCVDGWALGRNRGPTAEIVDGMPRLLQDMAQRTGGPVSIIGWSLGGVYARELARENPDQVRQVITLGSPFALTDSRQSRAGNAFRRNAHLHVGPGLAALRDRTPDAQFPSRRRPSTRARTGSCRGRRALNRPVTRTRMSLCGAATSASVSMHSPTGSSPIGWHNRLGRWRPFEPPAAMRRLYPTR